jgi:dihydrofolate reductase
VSTVVFDISMSLDGFVRAANPTPETPLGDGGEALHTWAIGDADAGGRDVLSRAIGGLGAVICGRVTYDDSIRWWGADGPAGSARVPTFVVTHAAPSDVPADGVYVFVESGLEDALAQARAVAAGRTVSIMGGPTLGNQFLRAGLVDELSIHLVPVLFGSGQRLTEALSAHIELEPVEQLTTEHATHLRYRISR